MISTKDKIHGCDVGRGVVIGYTPEIGWWAYVENPNLRRKIEKGKTKYITKAKTVRITRGGKTYEVQKRVRIPVREVWLVKDLSEVVKEGDVVVLERTGSNGLRYARMFQDLGAAVYLVDGKLFNRFRSSFGSKDDFSDAKGLYTYAYLYAIKREEKGIPDHLRFIFRDMKDLRLYRLIDVEVKVRYLINAYRRADKDLTNAINRLKDHLTAFLPDSAPFRTRMYILSHLDEFPAMIEDPDYRKIIKYEIERVKMAAKMKERIAVRIREILQAYYPEEYELLQTIPHISIIQIAVLLAYGGMRVAEKMIRTRDELIGYALEGSRRTQSGETDARRKDKERREVLHVFWMHYIQAHQEKHPLHPLVEYLRTSYGGDITKKRYRKYLDKILEVSRLMLKYRLTFEQAVLFRARRLERHLKHIYEQVGGAWELMSQRRLREAYHVAASLKAYREILRITGEDAISRIIDEVLRQRG